MVHQVTAQMLQSQPVRATGEEQQSPVDGEQILATSAHAEKRMRQRGLSYDDVFYVVRHGMKWHAADARIYYLRDKDLPSKDSARRERLRGTAVVVSRDEPLIITVWRNRKGGLRHIKRKPPSAWQLCTGSGA